MQPCLVFRLPRQRRPRTIPPVELHRWRLGHLPDVQPARIVVDGLVLAVQEAGKLGHRHLGAVDPEGSLKADLVDGLLAPEADFVAHLEATGRHQHHLHALKRPDQRRPFVIGRDAVASHDRQPGSGARGGDGRLCRLLRGIAHGGLALGTDGGQEHKQQGTTHSGG